MKKWLKYILPLLCLVALFDINTERQVIAVDCSNQETTTEAILYATDIDTPHSQLCLQRTFHLELLQRISSHTRRSEMGNQCNYIYYKAGKIINPDIYINTSHHSQSFLSVLSEHTQRLICLGRLII